VLQVRTHAQKHFLKLAKEEGLDAATSLYRGSYGWSEQKLNVSHGLALHKGDAADDADESSGAVDRAADGAGGGRAKKPRARRPRKPRATGSGAVFSSAAVAAGAGGKKRPSLGAGGGVQRSSAVASGVSVGDGASDGPATSGAAAAADPGSQPRRSGRARRPNPRVVHGADDESEGASAAAGPGRRTRALLLDGEAWEGAGGHGDSEGGQQAYESRHGQGAGSARALSDGGTLLHRRHGSSGGAAADSEGEGQGHAAGLGQRPPRASSPPRQRRRLDSTGSSAAVAALVGSRGSALADYGFKGEEGGSEEEGGAPAAEGDDDVWGEAGEGEYTRGNGTHRTRVDAGERRRSDTESSSEAVSRPPFEAGDDAASEAPGLQAAHRTSRQRQGSSARPRQRGAANGRRARLASTVSATSAASLAPTVSDPQEAQLSGLPQDEADEDEEAEAETERSAFGGLSAAVSPDAAATIASILLDWRGRPTRSVSCGSSSSTAGAPLAAAAAAAGDETRDRDTAGVPVACKGPSPTDSSRSSLSATNGGTRSGGSSAFAAFSGSTGPVEVPPAALPQQALALPAPSLPHHHFSGGPLAASSLPLDWTAPGAGSLRQHQQRLQHASAAPAAAGLPGEGPAAGFAAAAAAYRSLAPHSVLLANYSAPAPAAAAAAGGVAAGLALPLRSPVPGAGSAGMHGVGPAAGGSVGTAFSNPGAPGSRVGSPASSHSPSPSAAASSGLLLESMAGGAGSSGAGGGAAAMPALPSFGYGGHIPHHHHAYPLPIVGGPFPLLHMRAAGPPGSLLHPHRQRHPSVHSRHEGDSDEEEAERGRQAVAAAAGMPPPRAAAAAGCVASGAVSAAVSDLGVGMGGPGHQHSHHGHQHSHSHDVLGTSPLPPSSQALGGPDGAVEGLGPGPGERGASAGPLGAGGGFGVSLHTSSPPHPHAPASTSAGRLSRCDGGASGGSSGSGGLPAAFGLSTSPAAPAELVPLAPRSSGGSAASIAGPFPPSAAALQLHAMTAGRHSPHDMQLLVPSRGPGAGLDAGAPHLLPHAHTVMQPHSALQHSRYPAHYPLGARAPASASFGSSLGAAAVKGVSLPDPSPTTASAAAAVLLLKR